MKSSIAFSLAVLLIFVSLFSEAQGTSNTEMRNAENEIRRLENVQREAFLKKDISTLWKNYSPNFVVNSPLNNVVSLNELRTLIEEGRVDLASFERVTEKITFHGNVAISMGHETVQPIGKAPNAGKVVKRRYTNIWMHGENGWQLIARQATIISVQ